MRMQGSRNTRAGGIMAIGQHSAFMSAHAIGRSGGGTRAWKEAARKEACKDVIMVMGRHSYMPGL